MFSYNKKVRLKPYEVIPLADFNVEPDAPPLRMIRRPGKIFSSHSRADLTHDFNHKKPLVAPMNLKRPKSAMELSSGYDREFESRNSNYVSEDVHDEIAESSKELIECLPRMTAVKQEKKESNKKDSLSLDTPATGTRDCMMVLPQNTVPMAKYRKKISGELPDTDDEEAPMTDAQRWNKEKSLQDSTSSRKKRKSLWADPDPNKYRYDLNDQIRRPTYMGDESLESETLTALLAKGSRRKSLAAIGTVVAKLAKRRQSTDGIESSGDMGYALGRRRPTVVKFDVPDDEDDKMSHNSGRTSSAANCHDVELGEVALALPPALYMDTKTMISLSENLVSKIVNERRTPANALSFPLPSPTFSPAPSFSLATIPEVERPPTTLSDVPVFIRPPETPFEKSDDATSEDDFSGGRRPRRHSSRSSHKRHRASKRNSISGNSGDYDDAELDKERSRRRREAKRRQSSKKDADEKRRVQKSKSTRKSRRRGSDVREKVGLDQLDRAKKGNQQSDESVEEESLFKFASFLKGSEPKSSSLSKSESFALESFARKLINLVQQNGDTKGEGSNDSDVALIEKSPETPVSHHQKSDHDARNFSDNQYRSSDLTRLIQPDTNVPVQTNHAEVTNPVENALPVSNAVPAAFQSARDQSKTPAALYPQASSVTVVRPDDLPDIFEPRDGDTLKTVVRLPSLKEQAGETEDILRKRVEDFLNGNSEEGDSHFQQVPGRRWVAEWAKREVVGSNKQSAADSENKKIKRKRSSLSRKRSIKRNPSTSSIGTFFSKIFGRLRIDDETSDVKITEVVACVYAVRTSDAKTPSEFSTSIASTNIAPAYNTNAPATSQRDVEPPMTSRSAAKVAFLDEIANSKDSGVFSDKGLDSVDELGRFQAKARSFWQSWGQQQPQQS